MVGATVRVGNSVGFNVGETLERIVGYINGVIEGVKLRVGENDGSEVGVILGRAVGLNDGFLDGLYVRGVKGGIDVGSEVQFESKIACDDAHTEVEQKPHP